MDEKFLRVWHVEDMTGWKKSKIWAMAKEGTFPAPYRIDGHRITVWRHSEIQNWMLALVEQGKQQTSTGK